jgi:tRNA (guanine6-N2)-methyltransferase
VTTVRLDVVPGLVPVLIDELGGPGAPPTSERTDKHVVVDIDRRAALKLRTVYAAYAQLDFDVPRPKALLGDVHLRAITNLVRDVADTQPFTSVRIGAAGADSPVMRRLADEIAKAAELPHDPDDGDLLVRIIPSWKVLVRLTPRPLSNRPWHEPGFEGALDASVGAAMVRLTNPRADDIFLDPVCGSGTIVAERRSAGPHTAALGSDIDPSAPGARIRADATRLPLPDGVVTALCANPPWGHQFESADDLNERLLAEAGRVASADARFVVVTHDIRRFERALRAQHRWRELQQLTLDLRGHHPRIWVLGAADSMSGGRG